MILKFHHLVLIIIFLVIIVIIGNIFILVFKKHRGINIDYYNELITKYKNDKILLTCVLAGEWLVKNQLKNGKFNYSYDPWQNSYSSDYNLLRHAGTAYSLARLYKYVNLSILKESARKAIDYLLNFSCNSSYGWYIDDGRRPVPLGGTALATLAAIEYDEVAKESTFKREINEMGLFLRNQQTSDGSINCYYSPDQGVSYGDNDYYAGEALLAIARLYEHTGDYNYYVVLEKAFPYYKNYYILRGYTPFAPWGIEAFVRWYQYSKNQDVLDFCYSVSDATLEDQYTNLDICPKDYVGGFGKISGIPPRSNTASKIEGVVDTYYLAVMTGNKSKMSQYNRNIVLAAKFLINLQIDLEDSLIYPCPEKCIGGIPGGVKDSEIRIDYLQHAIVTLLKIRDYGIET